MTEDMSRAKVIAAHADAHWTGHGMSGLRRIVNGAGDFLGWNWLDAASCLPAEPKVEGAPVLCHLKNGLICRPHGGMAFRGCTDCGPDAPCIPMAEMSGSSLGAEGGGVEQAEIQRLKEALQASIEKHESLCKQVEELEIALESALAKAEEVRNEWGQGR